MSSDFSSAGAGPPTPVDTIASATICLISSAVNSVGTLSFPPSDVNDANAIASTAKTANTFISVFLGIFFLFFTLFRLLILIPLH